jgi:hypothetical protein
VCIDEFPERAADLVNKGVYTYEDEYYASIGSYGRYIQWREQLSLAVLGVTPETVWDNPEPYQDKPFYPLIHFEHDDGTMGTAVCTQLLADFRTYPNPYPDDRDFTHIFESFERTLVYAADGGYLVFG